MKIYIASSWRNQHAVEMLTTILRQRGAVVKSFVEHEGQLGLHGKVSFHEWIDSKGGEDCFLYDTSGAAESDLMIYVGPSGIDAWAEVGVAFASARNIVGLWGGKNEQVGLMRRMITTWFGNYHELMKWFEEWQPAWEAAQKK